MTDYEPVLSMSAMRVIARLPLRRADAVLDLLAVLPLQLGAESQPTAEDAVGRPLHRVILENKVGVVFWIDHGARQFRIVSLELRRR